MKARDFNWEEGTVVILGKGNRYRKALAGNGIVRDWLTTITGQYVSRDTMKRRYLEAKAKRKTSSA